MCDFNTFFIAVLMSETEVVCIVNSCNFFVAYGYARLSCTRKDVADYFVSMCSWKNGSCRDGVKVLKCHCLVWLLFYMNLCRLYCLMWFCKPAVVMQVFWWFHIEVVARTWLVVHGVQTTGRHQNAGTETGMESRMEMQTEMGTGMWWSAHYSVITLLSSQAPLE